MSEPIVPSKAALKKYGMDQSDWIILFNVQQGKCEICTRTLTRLRVAVVDHCHKTGEVRGLLCMPCNHALGVLHDDAEWLANAAHYLRVTPASRVFDEPRRHTNAPPKGER